MPNATSTPQPADRTRSELALLVDTEQRLERELAAAREQAAAIAADARARVAQANAALAAEIAADRARIAADIERDRVARLHALAATTERELARLDAVRDDRAAAIANHLAARLVASVLAEDVP